MVQAFPGTLQAESSIHGEDLAGDELWRGGEEQDSGGDLFRAAVAVHGRLFGHALHEGCGRFFAEVDHAGRDRVYRDLGRQGFCHDLGQHVEGGF